MPIATMQTKNKDAFAVALEQATGRTVKRDVLLSQYNSLRVGGLADLFIEVCHEQELIGAVQLARRSEVPFLVIGNGTNLIFTDAGVRGLVIRNRADHFEIKEEYNMDSIWYVESGTLWGSLCREAAQLGWGDITWGISIPGSLGGAVVSNAGAHGGELDDVLVSARVLNTGNDIEDWPAARFKLAYRSSVLKAEGRRQISPPLIVTAVTIRLHRMDTVELQARMKQWQRDRIASQPAGKTVGSTFKNPPGDSAGRLLEAAGLKGYRYREVEFSPKHANFLMNLGAATYADVKRILSYAQETVWQKFGVRLEPEVEIVGEDV
ncbi:MAG: UDP-N-acetylmuramate dehydrogenase [Candidatus Chloroheliales bacterium]|nr:MAG: UDP-N-acetylmuramate dehydrogenase [Chloroflexota bacterium]